MVSSGSNDEFQKIIEDCKSRIINFDDCCVAYSVSYWYCKGFENGCFYESDVYGSNPYTCDSGVCKAALHHGIIKSEGGFVKVILIGRLSSFQGTSMNGITSLEWKQPMDAVRLENSDIPFDFMPDMSCGFIDVLYCNGINNSCRYMSYKTLETIYGSNPYSFDSNKCKTALHSGCVDANGGFYITYPVGQVRSFRGILRNGISSLSWIGYWEGFKCTIPNSEIIAIFTKKFKEIENNKTCNKTYIEKIFYCKGKSNGCLDDHGVWGSNPYTYDSSACRSALHSGVISNNGGLYLVEPFQIFDSFNATNANGITSENWIQNYEGMNIKKLV